LNYPEFLDSCLFGSDLKNNDVLPKITDLALDKKPPFEDKDKSDKGFKDALIYFSVLEYLQETPNKKVFLCVVAKFLALIRYSIFVLYNSGLEVLIISLDSTSITYSVSCLCKR
jgi:hypothetical protein